jgi:hypothetical protein
VAVGIVLAGALAGILAGCTFLIQFDDVAKDGVDGGPPPRQDGEAPPPPPGDDVGADGDVIDTGVPFPPPCDPTFPESMVACNAMYPRPECASETGIFPSYPTARGGDVVECNGGAHPFCVRHCPYGCFKMTINGFSDFCDGCKLRAQGTYCAKDMGGPDEGIAVDCDGGKIVDVHTCGAGRGTSQCPRTTDPHQPACCI